MVSSVNPHLTIGIVAGEASGDLLGANLIRAIQAQHPQVKFIAIAGPQMLAAGCASLFPMEKLSVMGLVEVLKHLPEILKIRRKLLQYFLENPPDIFIGIDAPDFNLSLEQALKKTGIPTVHYVSPTVWAWKQWRLKKIAKSVNLMLTLLPFESRFYQEKNIPVEFVGHPFADEIPLQIDKAMLRKDLNLPADKKIIALLPGSRVNEINYLGELFIQAAEWCLQHDPHLLFVAPMVNAARYQQFNAILLRYPHLPIKLVQGQSRQVMGAADAVLLASGTATLEALLMKTPMVVAYRMSSLTYAIVRRMVNVSYVSLPNLLANQRLVPEFIQQAATPEALGRALLHYLENPTEDLITAFNDIHQRLRMGAGQQAASAVLKLCREK